MSGKPVWRFVALVGDKQIMKQGENKEKIQKSIRNSVVNILCNYAGITYPMGWYNNADDCELHFLYYIVDLFIGIPQIVMGSDPIENNVKATLIIPPSEVIKYFGSKDDIENTDMKPQEIDDNGNWYQPNGKKVPLLGSNIPVPENVRLDTHPEYQPVLIVMTVQDYVKDCPNCGDELVHDNPMIVTEFSKMIPARCCNTFVWITEFEDDIEKHI